MDIYQCLVTQYLSLQSFQNSNVMLMNLIVLTMILQTQFEIGLLIFNFLTHLSLSLGLLEALFSLDIWLDRYLC